jgi:hypothetical protein
MKLTLKIAPVCLILLTSAVAWGQGDVNSTPRTQEQTPETLTQQAATVTLSGAIPPSYFGMHTMNVSDWPTIPFGALGKGNDVAWPYVERSKGQRDWSVLDSFVNLATDHGLSFTYSNVFVPKWAASNQSSCTLGYYDAYVCRSGVSNIQDWKNFVTALVTRYKGRIKVYELWNEPQNSFTGTMAQLVAMTNAEHDIIRAIDPSATILSPSMISYGYPFLDSYFAAGGTKAVDAVAMHAYPNPNNDVAEFIMGSVTSGMRNVMSKHGLSSKALWDTEHSWGQTNAGAITDSNLRSAFIARAYLLHWYQGITRVYWYEWDNTIDGTLWSPSTGTQQAGIALGQVYSWLNGATMSGCSLNGSTSFYHALYTCDLTRKGYQERAVWYTDGSRSYTAPSQFTQYRDLAGGTHTIPSNHVVTIGTKPILLVN